MHRRAVLLATLVLAAPPIHAQNADDATEVSLEDLLEVSVASGRSTRVEDAPGVVTVISHEQITRSGARDIDDVLQFVPGFQFASDYYGTVSYGFRGLWGMEGKVLQMVDGVEQNDVYYNSAFVQNRVPIDEIDHIEIIRGPGSATYGGAAEYAVINIVTRNGAQLHGARVSATYGQMRDSWGRGTLDFQAGEKYVTRAGDLDVSLKIFTGRAQRGDGERTYPDGSQLPMSGNYVQTPIGVNGAITFNGLSVRVLLDGLSQDFRDYTGAALNGVANSRFDHVAAVAKYELRPAPDVTVTPEYGYSRSNAFAAQPGNLLTMGGDPTGLLTWDIVAERHKLALPVVWDPVSDVNLRAGVEYAYERALSPSSMLHPNPDAPATTSSTFSRQTGTAYAQATWSSFLGGLTGAVRYERSDRSGDAVVPRFVWTRSLGPLYAKALYSFAYRSPSVGNLSDAASTGARLSPERTRSAEVEVGWQLTARQTIAANVFDLRVDGPIVYDAQSQTYANAGSTGSRGVEAQYRGSWNAARVNLGASVYDAGGLNSVAAFAVATDPRQLAAFARFKATAQASLRVARGVWLTPQLIWLGGRTTFASATATAAGLGQVPVDATVVADLMASWENVLGTGASITGGVHNLFNASNDYLVAYDLGRDRMPGPSREILLRVGYQATF